MPAQANSGKFAKGIVRWLSLFCALVLSTLWITGCGAVASGEVQPTPTPLPPQPAVEKPIYTVERGDIVEELQLSGRVAAVLQDDLHFEQAGNVAEIHVRPNEAVTEGQLLAELNQGDLQNQLAQAELVLDQAKLALQRGQEQRRFAIERAELDLQEAQTRLRLAETAGEQELAQINVRKAEISLEEVQAQTDEDLEKEVDQAQLDYDRIKAQVDAGRLYAPYDGEVSAISVAPGDPVEAYQPVMTVIDPSEKIVRVDNPASTDLSRLSPQQPVTIRFARYRNTPVEGVIEQLPHGATTSQSGVRADSSIQISYDAGDLELDIGELATVIVTLQRNEDVLWLPPQAVRNFQGRRFVVIQDGDRQRRVDVKVGIASADRVEIVEGLEEGQEVVGQ